MGINLSLIYIYSFFDTQTPTLKNKYLTKSEITNKKQRQLQCKSMIIKVSNSFDQYNGSKHNKNNLETNIKTICCK